MSSFSNEDSERMSPFTDEHLKRLKEEVEGSNPSWQIHIESDMLNGLLARLEDSEDRLRNSEAELKKLKPRLEAAESLLDDINYDVFSCDDWLLEGWKAWRKSQGEI